MAEENEEVSAVSEPEEPEEEPPPEGAPAWMATYGDMVTLLFAFFVLLFAMGSPDKIKFDELMDSLKDAMGVTVIPLSGMVESDKEVIKEKSARLLSNVVKKQTNEIESEFKDLVTFSKLKDKVKVTQNKSGVTIAISDVLLFSAGEAKMQRKGLKVLRDVAKVLKKFKYPILIIGHTDNTPIRTRKYPSNWELSMVRACEITRFLHKQRIRPELTQAVGYAEFQPIASNSTPRGRAQNRRVEIKYERQKIAEAMARQ